MNGGYFMIDASGLVLSTGGTISGLYKQCQEALASGKPAFMYNAAYSTSSGKYSPFSVALTQAENVIYIDAAQGSYTLSSSDVVSSNA